MYLETSKEHILFVTSKIEIRKYFENEFWSQCVKFRAKRIEGMKIEGSPPLSTWLFNRIE